MTPDPDIERLLRQELAQIHCGRPNGAALRESTSMEAAASDALLPTFPEMAWRGIFADYRDIMRATTEASDVAHFATLWAAASVNLGRRVSMYAGDEIFPNSYLLFFGSTGDKKTTAARRIFSHNLLHVSVQVVRNAGSPEGMLDALQQTALAPAVYLCFFEEISTLLKHGRWQGSTLLEFFTETFDCPPVYRPAYRNSKAEINQPTPSVLAGTTAEWFWKNAQAEDFHGGFGNRMIYLTGSRKPPLPSPAQVDESKIEPLRSRLHSLATTPQTTAAFSPPAKRLFDGFYVDWERADRSGLYAAAVKRIPVYVRKLAMVYAACEETLPEVTCDQTAASIAIGKFAAECTRVLVDLKSSQARPEGEFEQRVLSWLEKHDGSRKREMQQTLSKYAGSCEVFNRAVDNLVRADRVRIEGQEKRVYLIR
jgi:hypothetical protein